MEDVFKELLTNKNNTVDNLIKWLKDSKLMDASKDAEDKARKLFSDVTDVKNVQLDKFKDVVKRLAADQKKTVDELNEMLASSGPQLQRLAQAGVSALHSAFANK